MGSNSKIRKLCIEDRISGFPDEVLCHILSFLPTKDAVKTSVLSHRWDDVWTFVPNIDLDLTSQSEFDHFAVFVDRVLLYRSSSKIHRFKLRCRGFKDDFSRIDSWIRTVVRRNVVELELDLFVDWTPNTYQGYPLPKRLLMCNTLVVLKLTFHGNDITATPSSGCFPSLKFLHVTVRYPEGDSMEKLFSCCPALEDLIIEGVLEEDSVLNFIISGPKLRRLRISLNIDPFPFDGDEDYKMLDYKYKILINANAPNLEEFDIRENFLASYSLSKAKLLSKAKIDLGDLHAMEDLKFIYESARRIQGLFAGIINVTYLSLSAPIFGDHYIQTRYNLPMFYNLKHLELHLQTCCSWQYLTKLLQISPNLEYLVFENNIKCSLEQCEGELLVHEWCPPKIVPICLWSRLKTICIRGFQGRPDEMEVTKYLLKHGRFLNMVKICTSDFSAEKEMKVRQELQCSEGLQELVKLNFPKLNSRFRVDTNFKLVNGSLQEG